MNDFELSMQTPEALHDFQARELWGGASTGIIKSLESLCKTPKLDL